MVRAAFAVLVEQFFDLPGIEKTRIRCTGRAPGIAREVAEPAYEPIGKGHLESEFSPIGRAFWKQRLDCAPEHIFTSIAAKFEIGRNGQCPVDKAVSKEGDASLERVSHRGTVQPLQERGRHVDREVAERELLEG